MVFGAETLSAPVKISLLQPIGAMQLALAYPFQLLQHRHTALDIAEAQFQPFFRSANPFEQKSLFEFPLFFELPHKRGCLPIEFQHWCPRIPLLM